MAEVDAYALSLAIPTAPQVFDPFPICSGLCFALSRSFFCGGLFRLLESSSM